MHLPSHQTDIFYRIWLALLHYVNGQLHLVPPFSAIQEKAIIPPSDAMQLRNALWADDALRETFIATNPAGLPSTDLALVTSWQYRLTGAFFIVRHLKKYSVFLSEQATAHAYGVLGLISPIEDVVGPMLPLYVQGVLLPFEDHIIYDSILQPYPITFGSGIRSRLNATYRDAQEREGIITSLAPANAPANLEEARNGMLARNAKIVSAFRKDLARRSLSHTMVEQHASNIEAFAQTYLLTQDPPHALLDMTPADVQTYLRTAESKTTTTSFKRFVRFLTETERMDYEQTEPLRALLKHMRE